MKISNYQEFTKENFPKKYYDLTDSLIYPLNNFQQQIVTAFNNNQITVTDNLNEQYKTLTVTVDSTGKPAQTLTYQSTLTGKTVGIIVVAAKNQTSSTTYPTGTPFISWSDNSGTVTIANITNLQANNQYQLVIRSMG